MRVARLRLISSVSPSIPLPTLIDLTQQESTVFGRSSQDSNVVLDSTRKPRMISRIHARIIADPTFATYSIFDNKSINGIFVNDRRVESAILKEGDVITFGGAMPSTKFGDLLPQPYSEFVYRFEFNDHHLSGQNNNNNNESGGDVVDKATSAFESMKSVTENITVIFTWISALVVGGNYLFAEENSQEYSYIRTYIKPIFDFVSIPFTRLTLIAFILSIGLVCFLVLHCLLLCRKRRSSSSSSPSIPLSVSASSLSSLSSSSSSSASRLMPPPLTPSSASSSSFSFRFAPPPPSPSPSSSSSNRKMD
eukprot:TRINITY_DN298_c3_g1_i1.p1 TRINITY_DN298_c3_g1~~TRINITY_DN298_c3_g1_i1.p1  ORF type:complete len:327 (+),score=119.09 TRINITY_DN298_c3_g1_i1:59-982(+)